jgi:acyl-CoA reductase-like NAD-dependent aldehyde dehydrogenase/nicotinamidase-related amidase
MPRPLLLLIDLQNDFLNEPRLEPHKESVIAGAAALLEKFRRLGLPVAHARLKISPDGADRMPHWVQNNVFSCVEGSSGFESPDELRPLRHEKLFDKTSFSAFGNPDLPAYLRDQDIGLLVLAGVHLQSCIRQTALDAYARGLQVYIARDASGSHDPLHGAQTLDYLGERAIPNLGTSEILARVHGDFEASVPASNPGPMVAKARAAQALWARTTLRDRCAVLRKLGELLLREQAVLARQIVLYVNKPVFYALGEVERSVALLNAAAARAEDFVENRREAEGTIRTAPRGVAGLITPWNNPLAIPIGKLAPALAYGNAVVWKPAPAAGPIAAALRPLLDEAGVPRDLVQIVHGDAAQARAIIAAGIDAVAFSGSSRTGWSIIAQAAGRLLPLQAELGGNNAAIICADADLAHAAAAIVEGAFGFAGQRCTANRRVIVLAEVYEAFLAALERAAKDFSIGDVNDMLTRMGPMVSVHAARQIATLVQRCRNAGLAVMQPQGQGPAGDNFHPPTIILCDRPESFIVQEESFGPILVVQRAGTFDEALDLMNGVPHGLVAAIFTHDPAAEAQFLSRALAGILKLNSSTVNAGVDIPFNGWKRSGYGAAEHGEANAEFFTKRQAIYNIVIR